VKQELSVTGKQQLSQIQERVAQIQDEVSDLIKQMRLLSINVDILRGEMKELKLLLANLGNLMQLPAAAPRADEDDRDTPVEDE
jgi:chromosome segregation ATPase